MNPSRNRFAPSVSPTACALERLPHLVTRVETLWGQAEFEPYVNYLIMESRDGKRQGLPWDAAQELLFLVELSVAKRALKAAEMTGAPFRQMYALCFANSRSTGGTAARDYWSDPTTHNGVGRMGRSPDIPRRASVDPRWEIDRTWWRRLFG